MGSRAGSPEEIVVSAIRSPMLRGEALIVRQHRGASPQPLHRRQDHPGEAKPRFYCEGEEAGAVTLLEADPTRKPQRA